MIDKNNNLDEIDKMLFSYFDNNKDIPSSTEETILNAFKTPRKPISLIYKIQKVAIVLISLIVLTTGVVFAKDIINFITSLFTNTTEGINKAIENGYVQNVDMDFIYDNDIGIKVDYLVMDDSNLDVSFVYDYKGDEELTFIGIDEYIIRDDKNNLIYYHFKNDSEMKLGTIYTTDYTRTQDKILDTTGMLRESILYKSNKFPNSKTLIFEIHSLKLNNTKITGTWIFNLDIEKNISNNSIDTYSTSYNKYIDNIVISLEETSLNMKIRLNKKINEQFLIYPDAVILKTPSGEKFECLVIKTNDISKENKLCTELLLNFDISKYHDNIDLLYLEIKQESSENINIILSK